MHSSPIKLSVVDESRQIANGSRILLKVIDRCRNRQGSLDKERCEFDPHKHVTEVLATTTELDRLEPSY
jgi:hypothetical protein